jgi:hypothetical protein
LASLEGHRALSYRSDRPSHLCPCGRSGMRPRYGGPHGPVDRTAGQPASRQLLGLHALLAVRQMRSAIAAAAPELQRAAGVSLQANTEALGRLVGTASGSAQADRSSQAVAAPPCRPAGLCQGRGRPRHFGHQDRAGCPVGRCQRLRVLAGPGEPWPGPGARRGEAFIDRARTAPLPSCERPSLQRRAASTPAVDRDLGGQVGPGPAGRQGGHR